MKCVSFIAAVVLLAVCVHPVDAKSPNDNGDRKVVLRAADGVVVRINVVRVGDATALEIKVRLKGGPSNAMCSAFVETIWPGDLDEFMTDEKGKGETSGVVYLPDGFAGYVPVMVMIMCIDEAGNFTPYLVSAEIFIAP